MSNTGYTVSSELKADVSKFKRSIQSAINNLKRYENVVSKIKDVELSVDIKSLKAKIDVADKALEKIDGKKVNASVDVSTKEANTKIEQHKRALRFLDNKVVKSAIGLKDKIFLSKIRRSKKELDTLNRKEANTKLDIDDGVAKSKIQFFKAMLSSIPNRIKTKVDVDTSNAKRALDYLNRQSDVFMQRMDRLAKSIRTWGTVLGNFVKGILISSFSALIPIIASIVPVVMAVGNALGVVGGGALGLAGAFSVAGVGILGFGLMAKTATSMLEDGLIQASQATYAYKSSLEGLKSTWQNLVRSNADSIFGAMASGISALTTALVKLQPFLSNVASLVNDNMNKFSEWVANSKTAQAAFRAMNTTGVNIFKNLLKAVGGFGDGLVNIFTQFMPLFDWVAQGFANMGASFQEWANKVSTQEGIAKFIDYVKVNLPLIGKIFGDTFMGIFNLFKAFAPNSQSIFESLSQMTGKFREWSETLSQSEGFKKFVDYIQQNGPTIVSLIGNVIMVLVNFGVAMAPIGSAVLSVVTAITGFVAKLFETHPAIAQVIGIANTFGGVLMSLATSVIGFASFIAPLIARFGFLRTTMLLVGRVVTLLSGPLKLLGVVFRFLMGPIGLIARLLPILGSALAFLITPVGLVIAAVVALVAIFVVLWNKNEAFRNFIINTWNAIKEGVTKAVVALVIFMINAWQRIGDFLINLWNSIVSTASLVWNSIVTLIRAAVMMAWLTITTVWTTIVTFLSTLWNSIVAIATTIWNVLVTVIVTYFTTIWNMAVTVWTTIFSFLSTIWNTIVSVASAVWNGIVTLITTALQTTWSFISSIWNTIFGFLSGILGRISSTVSQRFSQVYQWISTKILQAYSILNSVLSNMWSAVSSKFSEIVSTVISKMTEFYNNIKSKVQDALNAVKNFASSFVEAGRDLIMGLVNGVKDMAGNLIEAVKGAVGNAIDAAKSLLGIKSPSRVFKAIGVYTMQGLAIGINKEGSSAVSNVADVAKRLSSTFNPMLNSPNVPDIQSSLQNASASITSQVEHTHTIENSPRMKTVRIEMKVDNDAIYGIVNDKGAIRNAIFEL